MVYKLFKGKDQMADMKPENLVILHAAVGLAGECGEAMDAACRDNIAETIKEFGDIEFYLEAFLQNVYTPDQYLQILTGIKPREQPGAGLLKPALELLDYVKKVAFYNKPIELNVVTPLVRDIIAHLYFVYNICGFDREGIKLANMTKLLERYPDGKFSNDAAINRKDVK